MNAITAITKTSQVESFVAKGVSDTVATMLVDTVAARAARHASRVRATRAAVRAFCDDADEPFGGPVEAVVALIATHHIGTRRPAFCADLGTGRAEAHDGQAYISAARMHAAALQPNLGPLTEEQVHNIIAADDRIVDFASDLLAEELSGRDAGRPSIPQAGVAALAQIVAGITDHYEIGFGDEEHPNAWYIRDRGDGCIMVGDPGDPEGFSSYLQEYDEESKVVIGVHQGYYTASNYSAAAREVERLKIRALGRLGK